MFFFSLLVLGLVYLGLCNAGPSSSESMMTTELSPGVAATDLSANCFTGASAVDDEVDVRGNATGRVAAAAGTEVDGTTRP